MDKTKKKRQEAKSKIRAGIKHLKVSKNATPRKMSSLQKQIKQYEQDRKMSSTSRKSSQAFEEELSSIQQEYQTKTDIIQLMASMPITDKQFNDVKERAHTLTLKGLVKTLEFKRILYGVAKELETSIEEAIESKNLDYLFSNFGRYENNIYSDDYKARKYMTEIKKLELKDEQSIQSKPGKALKKQLDKLISKKDTIKNVEMIKRLEKLKTDKVDPLQRGREKQHFIRVVDFLILTCSDIVNVEKVESEITDLVKTQEEEQIKRNLEMKTKIKSMMNFIQFITSVSEPNIINKHIDDLEEKIQEYQLLPGPKDPIVLGSGIIHQQMLRKEAVLNEKKDKLREYLTKKKIERSDLPNIQVILRDIEMYYTENVNSLPSSAKDETILFLKLFSIIENELNFEAEIKLEEDPPSMVQSESTSFDITSNEIVEPIYANLKTGEKIRDKLIHQKIGNNIPVIILNMHGTVIYDDEMQCSEINCPIEVLYRFIQAAPYEVTTFKPFRLVAYHLSLNPKLKDPNSTIKEIVEEAKIKLFKDSAFDTLNFAYFQDDHYMVNFNSKKRDQCVINYKDSSMCYKILQIDNNSSYMMGIYVVNNTSTLAKTNLIENDDFINYVKHKNNPNTKFITKGGKETLHTLTVSNLYSYLASKGIQQAVVIDTSCEAGTHTASSKLPTVNTKNQTIADDCKYLQANINFDNSLAKVIVLLFDKDFQRTSDQYKEYRRRALEAQKIAKHKSKTHAFSVINQETLQRR